MVLTQHQKAKKQRATGQALPLKRLMFGLLRFNYAGMNLST